LPYHRVGCVKSMLSTKPEVHDISQRRQKWIEPRPQATCITFVKFSRVVSEICEQTDKQTYSSQYFALLHEESS